MKTSSFSLVILVFLLVFYLTTSYPISQAKGMKKTMPPILDNSVVPNCQFIFCEGEEQTFNWERLKKVSGMSDKTAKKFKSKKVIVVDEEWIGYGSVTINRWYLDCPGDAALLPATGMTYTGNIPFLWGVNENFKGCDKIIDIGDKSCWRDPGLVYFTKGNILVRVCVNSSDIDKNPERLVEYTKKIAQHIAKKL